MSTTNRKSVKILGILGILFISIIALFAFMGNGITAFAANQDQDGNSGKVYSNVTIDEDFDGNTIIVILDKSISGINKKQTANLFENYVDDILDIEDLSVVSESARSSIDEKNFEQVLLIKLQQNDKSEVLKTIKQLEKMKGVRYAGPNRIFSTERTPNDPHFTDTTPILGQWDFDKIQAPLAWDITTGSNNIRVGIIDTGIANHADLNANVSGGGDFVNMTNSTTPGPLRADPDGHGTHVAGTVGAVGNNSTGITGANWNVTLVPMQVANATGGIVSAACVRAVVFARNSWNTANRISILSMSIGGSGAWPEIETEIRQYQGLFVCSTGNANQDNDTTRHYPSFYGSALHTNPLTNMISVGRSDINDARPTNANRGAQTITLYAPGQSILSTYPPNSCTGAIHAASGFLTCEEPVLSGGTWVRSHTHHDNGYHIMSGSSMATPHVSGVAALVLSANPNLTTAQLRAAIVGNVDAVSGLSTFCVTGGRLNAFKAVSAAAFTTTSATGGISITGFRTGYVMPNNTNLTLPERFAPLGTTTQQTVTAIGNSAFANQTSLSILTIPSSVKTIGANAFSGCSKLTIYAEATQKPSGWNNSWNPLSRPVYWSRCSTCKSSLSYVSQNNSSHMAECCNRTMTESHIYGEVSNCKKTCVSCGHEEESHSFSFEHYGSSTHHRAYCTSCSFVKEEKHTHLGGISGGQYVWLCPCGHSYTSPFMIAIPNEETLEEEVAA